MELKRVWIVVVMLIILKDLRNSEACWEQERIALLQLKHFFTYAFFVEESDANSNCCQWKNVVCNNSTGRVIELDISETRNWTLVEWYLNASLFLPFDRLEVLLSNGNEISGFIEDEGFERLSSRLSSLKVLDLSFNYLNNNILSLVGEFLSLKYINLRDNQLNGPIQIESIARHLKLKNLEFLDLTGNNLDNSILSLVSELPSLKSLLIGFNQLKGSMQINDALCNLEELSIRENNIEKVILPRDDPGKKCLSKLKELRIGSVDNNNISNLLQSLGPLPPLMKTLYLYCSTFNGTPTDLGLHNLTKLEVLNLGSSSSLQINFLQSLDMLTSLKNLSLYYQDINGTLTVQDMPNFNNLESLEIHGITLNNSFLQDIGKMNSLIFLSLQNCGLNGTLHSQGLCELKRLQELYMNDNNLEGDLPKCLTNLTSLQTLDLSGNQFTGDIASSPLKSMTSIESLSLGANHFKIPLSLRPFLNNSRLKYFEGDDNEVYDEGILSHSFIPKFQLIDVALSGFGHGSEFPQFLYYQHDLQRVDLSDIHLKGEFPHWLLENNTKLWLLSLTNNSFSGSLQLPITSHMNLLYLDISNNFFYGKIPRDIGVYLPRLIHLNMSMNAFTDTIPSSFGDMHSLAGLDLSTNQLIGGIPKDLGIGCLSLRELILSNNSLQGPILSMDFGLINLMRLYLDRNNFSGKLPDSLSNCSRLDVLDISNNHFFGGIPKWMGNMSNLRVIAMANNHVKGSIPMEFCQLDLRILDLSQNNISGRIPSCFSPPQIVEVYLSKNRLQGTLEDAFSNSFFLGILDVSHNNLKGSIPKWINRLSQLSYLLLSNNDLEGEIPIQLCHLNQLNLIDLSHNKISGRIPNCLHITTLEEASIAPYYYVGVVYSPSTSFRNGGIEFMTKSMSYSYKGRILSHMFGVDLSCNKLIGEIPREIGNSSNIRALNLSHNFLFGPIPSTFANLKQIESLDLSNNNLSGKIPSQLIGIHFLSKFIVAYNNLSGKIPEDAQFATFDKSSYEANPLLCGKPLPKACDDNKTPSLNPNATTNKEEDGNGFIDKHIFYTSFMVSYTIMLLAIISVLYINPYWRDWWVYHIEIFVKTCYYFVVDNFPKRFCI